MSSSENPIKADQLTADLEIRLRARLNSQPPAGFHLAFTAAEFDELSEGPGFGGYWDGPTFSGDQWRIDTYWDEASGVSFHVEVSGRESIPVSESGTIAEILKTFTTLWQEPAGTGGGGDTVRATFTEDPENPNLHWGPEFSGGGCTITTHRVGAAGAMGIQVETPEVMTAADARELAASLMDAADSLDSVAGQP